MSRFLRTFSLLVLIAAGAAAQEAVRSLVILHTNDLHARLMPDARDRGGFARLATAIRREEKGCESCLLVNAGDLVQGTPVSTLFRGLPVYELARLFRFDVSTLGNHDFDYGWEMTSRFLKTAKEPVVSCNVADDQGRLLTRDGYVIRNVNGIRVAVIGAIMGNLTTYNPQTKLGPWHALPGLETVRKYASEARGRADIVVLLAHLEGEEQSAVLHQVPEVAVIVGAHVHEGLKGLQAFDGRVWVRGDSYGRELGRLELKVDVPAKRLTAWNWKRIPIDGSIPADPKMASQVAKWEKRVAKVVDVPIGESKRELAGTDLLAAIQRAMAEQMGGDFGLLNLGGIRDRLPKGRLLARNVWNVMPFDDRAIAGKFKGSELPPAVRRAHSVDPNREYTLVTTEFISETGALGTRGLKFTQNGPILRDLIIEWIRKQKTLE